MKRPAAGTWSKETRKRTLDLLNGGDLWPGPDGRVHFKHIDGRFAWCALGDAFGNIARIVDKKTDEILTFESFDDLVDAGWALD